MLREYVFELEQLANYLVPIALKYMAAPKQDAQYMFTKKTVSL